MVFYPSDSSIFAAFKGRFMSFIFRHCMFAIAILLLVEDFQYVFKIGPSALEQIEKINGGCEEDNGNTTEKEEEKKEEVKEQDKNKEAHLEHLSLTYLKFAKSNFCSARYFLSDIAHELETPPPEA